MDRFHLGIDYGTSASKLVLRHFEAPGGERAYLLEPDGRFRIPSGIAFSDRYIEINSAREDSFRSLKMRCAGEAVNNTRAYFHGSLDDFSLSLSSEDLVTLTIWRLISMGHLAAVNIARGIDFKMGMTLGVPMSFLDNETLHNLYLKMARVAYQMYLSYGPIGSNTIGCDLAAELLNGARATVEIRPPVPIENRRNWIRSETEASMFWSFKSPAMPASSFFCVDIGAGTTDSCAFMIKEAHRNEQWVKDGLVFFGAHSHPIAMDAIKKSLDINLAYLNVREGMVKAAQHAYGRIMQNVNSVSQWQDPRLIVLGGGALNQGLCSILSEHPMVNFRGTTLSISGLIVPTDLVRTDGSPVNDSDVVFTSVAYGLANLGEAVPVAERPTQVQPVRRHAIGNLPSHDEIYGD